MSKRLGQQLSKQMDRGKNTRKIEGDRISGLPDDLIHQILSTFGPKFVVKTSVLSKRWKLIWTTSPNLKFNDSVTFIDKFLSNRNCDSEITTFNLSFGPLPQTNKVNEFIKYAISHKVQVLNVDLLGLGAKIDFSTFNSTFVKNLTLNLNFSRFLELECWNLPELTTLNLTHYLGEPCTLPQSYFTCLLSLQNLLLGQFDLPDSIIFPALKTLHLRRCNVHTEVLDLPTLLTLTLDAVVFPDNDTSSFFSALVNLRELTLVFRDPITHDWVIDCPGLENLNIKAQMDNDSTHGGKIIVLSQQIRNFCSVGYFPITFEDSELKHEDVKLLDSNKSQTSASNANMKTYYSQVTDMFKGLGSAKTLTLDLDTIKVLSDVADYPVHPPSPFYNLKYVRIPTKCKISSMSAYLTSYLLDHSPEATIVTAFPKKIIPHIEAASVKSQNVEIGETMSLPTKILVDPENIDRNVCIETVEVGVQEEQVVQNSEVQVDALVEGTCNDQVTALRANICSGLWWGYEVEAEFVGRLDQIMSKYPRTFEHLTTKNKKFCKLKLNMLCTSVIDFTKIPLTEVDAKVIAEYRHIFADLQKLGFNVSWLVNRLNYIDQLHISQPLPELNAIDCRIDDAESELQDLQIQTDDAKLKLHDLQTLRSENMQEIQKPFGTTSTSLVVDYIGYDLLSSP
ncbi:uncharacterized protein LOC141686584 [Apium graveolens]|uniref:uncharacterized protein LOC141686584 n=1 Tax=Apium graveolens TaxID=4045 RepID=UPI003D79634B